MAKTEFLGELESIIARRLAERPDGSYTAELAGRGIAGVARKVGEEGVEVALASVTESNERLVEEAADLLFHLLVLLKVKGLALADVERCLARRHAGSPPE